MESAARLASSASAGKQVANLLGWTTWRETARPSPFDSQESFAALLAEHQRSVYGYLRARLIEPADADDLSQEVFLRSWLARERFDRSLGALAWLLGIARNVLREHVRKVSRRREVAWTELCLELDELVRGPDPGEARLVVHLPHCLESLGPSARQAIDLRYKSSLGLEALARHFRRSEGAVKLLMHRARTALRNCLERKVAAENQAR